VAVEYTSRSERSRDLSRRAADSQQRGVGGRIAVQNNVILPLSYDLAIENE
jgi:hypothetical protein